MKYLLIFIFIATLEAYIHPKTKASCPTGSQLGPDNRCYGVFGTADVCNLVWNQSRTYCQQKGGDLASISSAIVNSFVWNLLKNSKTVCSWGTKGAWIGLITQMTGSTCQWVWADGTTLSYSNWAYPTKCDPSLQFSGPSGYMQYADGKWSYDDNAETGYQIICAF
uniref:C-type lectin domain-containing protein n=1 Tax=Acrobeloides nanus TaxID=290746 RepID=A0A914CFG0_9BILA